MIDYHGLRLKCYPDSHSASGAIYFSGLPDYREMRFLLDYLRPGDHFLDVGANIGLYSLCAWSIIGPTGRIDAFEPAEQTASRLAENVRENGIENLTIHRMAVSDGEGYASFESTADDCTAHLAPESQEGPGEHQVPTVRLDRFLSNATIAMAKFDIEGHEPFALRGAEGLLRAGNPPVMQIEMAGYSRRYGIATSDLIRELAGWGYACGVYNPEARSITMTTEPWKIPVDNVLAVHRDHLETVLDRVREPANIG